MHVSPSNNSCLTNFNRKPISKNITYQNLQYPTCSTVATCLLC